MKRRILEQAYWHVYCRGSRRLGLFYGPPDYRKFLEVLAYSVKKSCATLHAYALMPNHYHLMISGSSQQLSACMHCVNQCYSRYHNEQHRSLGHSYDGPYRAHPQYAPYLTLCRTAYILANPVVAGLVDETRAYPWVSSGEYLGGSKSLIRVDASAILALLDPNPTQAVALFRNYYLRERTRPARKTECPHTEAMAQQFEWILEDAQRKHYDILALDPLDIAIYRARSIGVPPKAMALTLGMTDTSPLRRRLFEFSRRLATEPALRNKIDW